MKHWLWAVAVVAAACLVSPAVAQKGFGPKGGPEAKLKKLEAELKEALEQIQDLKAQLAKGKGAEKDAEKKKEEFKKKFEGKKGFGPGGFGKGFGPGKGFGKGGFGKGGFGKDFGKGKDFEKMKKEWMEKMEKFQGKEGMKKKIEGKEKEVKKKFETKEKGEKKKEFEPPFGKGFGPFGFKKPEGKPETPSAKAATTEQLLQQILQELKTMRKEMSKK